MSLLAGPPGLVVDLATGALVDRIEIAYDRAPDFPAIDPHLAGRPYQDFWMLGISKTGLAGRKFFDEVVHASWSHPDRVEVWQAPPSHYLGGEPAFAPNPSGGGGSVICQQFDAKRRRVRSSSSTPSTWRAGPSRSSFVPRRSTSDSTPFSNRPVPPQDRIH